MNKTDIALYAIGKLAIIAAGAVIGSLCVSRKHRESGALVGAVVASLCGLERQKQSCFKVYTDGE